MVDFLKHMSPEARAQHERHRARLAETIALDDAGLLGRAIHIMHNAGDPRGMNGEHLAAGVENYGAGLHHVVLPELLRRLAGGVLPQTCPVCGAWQDWDRAFVEAGEANAPQPAPLLSTGPEIWPLIIADIEAGAVDLTGERRVYFDALAADMRERHRLGCERYGISLQAGNGRDALLDAYHEALDLCAYTRQAIEEGNDRTRDVYWKAVNAALNLRRLLTAKGGVMEHKLHKCDAERCNVCDGGLALCTVCGGAEITLPKVCPGRRMTEAEEQAVRDGRDPFAVKRATQRDRARHAVGRLYANAVDAQALADLNDALGDAQNRPPLGDADGSIDEVLWTGLRAMADGFAEVQRVHEIIGRGRPPIEHDPAVSARRALDVLSGYVEANGSRGLPEEWLARLASTARESKPSRAQRIATALANAVNLGIRAAEERDPAKYQTTQRALLAWCDAEGVPAPLRADAERQFKERVAAACGPKVPAIPEPPTPTREWIDDALYPLAAMAQNLEGTCTDPACPVKGWHESHPTGQPRTVEGRSLRRRVHVDPLASNPMKYQAMIQGWKKTGDHETLVEIRGDVFRSEADAILDAQTKAWAWLGGEDVEGGVYPVAIDGARHG